MPSKSYPRCVFSSLMLSQYDPVKPERFNLQLVVLINKLQLIQDNLSFDVV